MNSYYDFVEVIFSFDIGGSERLAIAISDEANNRGKKVAVIAIMGVSGPIRDQLEKSGITCYGMGGGEVSSIIVRMRLFWLLLRIKPRALHIHHASLFAVTYYPAKIAHIPMLVLTEHANYSIKTIPRLNKRAKFYSKKADIVTTVHQGLKDYFVDELAVDNSKVLVIPNGVNTDAYSPGQKDPELLKQVGAPKDKFVFSCIGRLVDAKDHENLINAVSILVNNGVTEFIVLVIGDGYLRQEIETKINELNLQSYFVMLGARSDIKELFQISDVTVLSSKREGFPMVLLESMSCGVPCVATAVGGVPGVVTNENGIIVDPGDSEALAEAMKYMYFNRDQLQVFGAKSRELVLEKYKISYVLDKYLRLFD